MGDLLVQRIDAHVPWEQTQHIFVTLADESVCECGTGYIGVWMMPQSVDRRKKPGFDFGVSAEIQNLYSCTTHTSTG